MGKGFFDGPVQVCFAFCNHGPRHAFEIQVNRPRRSGGGLTECLPQEVGQLFDLAYENIVFCDGIERIKVIDLLIGVPVLIDLILTSCESDDRRAGEVGVLQSGGHIGRPDRLGHADAGSPARPGVAVRHVGCSLLPVGHYALDAEFLHFP